MTPAFRELTHVHRYPLDSEVVGGQEEAAERLLVRTPLERDENFPSV